MFITVNLLKDSVPLYNHNLVFWTFKDNNCKYQCNCIKKETIMIGDREVTF